MTTQKAAPEKLLAALQAARSELGEIEKTGTNKHFGYDFVQAEHLFAVVRPILHKHGIWIFQDIDMTCPPRVDEKGNTHIVFLFWVCHESGERLDLPIRMFASGYDSQDKGAYKANTGAWKYFLLRLFTFDSGEHEPEKDETAAERAARPILPHPDAPKRPAPQDAPRATKAPTPIRAPGSRASKADVKAAGLWKAAFRKAEEYFGDDKERKYLAMNWALHQMAVAKQLLEDPRQPEDLLREDLPKLLEFIGLYKGELPGPVDDGGEF